MGCPLRLLNWTAGHLLELNSEKQLQNYFSLRVFSCSLRLASLAPYCQTVVLLQLELKDLNAARVGEFCEAIGMLQLTGRKVHSKRAQRVRVLVRNDE